MICRQVHDALRSRIQRVDGEVLRLSAHREVLATDVAKLPAVVPPELERDAHRTEADWFDSGVTDDSGRLAERARDKLIAARQLVDEQHSKTGLLLQASNDLDRLRTHRRDLEVLNLSLIADPKCSDRGRAIALLDRFVRLIKSPNRPEVDTDVGSGNDPIR